MKVLITGSTGLVGQSIIQQLLAKGHSVNYLTTSRDKIKSQENLNGFYWSHNQELIDPQSLIGVDAIIHLAGATVAQRWTKKYKKQIMCSRVRSAKLLLNTLKKHPNQVKQFISASAIGIYPDSLTETYTEDYEGMNPTFLGKVVKRWEKVASKFKELSIGVCKIRIGLVLSEKGGALPQMAKPIRLGLGSSFGSGNQYQSWIHHEDLAALFIYALEHQWQGTFNAVAPNPVTQNVFTRTISNILNKPLWLPNVPKFIMRLILGDMHILLFESQKVSTEKVLQHGFTFKYEFIEDALRNLLKK